LARDFRRDGRLSSQERLILDAKLDQAGSRIRSYKHNDWNRSEYGYNRRW
jgi:hypothetical protein